MAAHTISWQEALRTVEQSSLSDQLRLISELLTRIQSVAELSEPIDLLNLAEVGADIWSKVDTNSYVNQERDSWQN